MRAAMLRAVMEAVCIGSVALAGMPCADSVSGSAGETSADETGDVVILLPQRPVFDARFVGRFRR